MTEDQLRAKRFNETARWFATACSNMALVILGWSFFGPAIAQTAANPNQPFWLLVAGILYLLGGLSASSTRDET
jgi:magnesium-transporting ATPase (P-type)